MRSRHGQPSWNPQGDFLRYARTAANLSRNRKNLPTPPPTAYHNPPTVLGPYQPFTQEMPPTRERREREVLSPPSVDLQKIDGLKTRVLPRAHQPRDTHFRLLARSGLSRSCLHERFQKEVNGLYDSPYQKQAQISQWHGFVPKSPSSDGPHT